MDGREAMGMDGALPSQWPHLPTSWATCAHTCVAACLNFLVRGQKRKIWCLKKAPHHPAVT